MEAWKEELYHHGIKGMKWGVRRFQNEDGSRTAAGVKRERINSKYSDGGDYTKAALKKYNKAADDRERVQAWAKTSRSPMRSIYKRGADQRERTAYRNLERANLADKGAAYKGGRYRNAANILAAGAAAYGLRKFAGKYAMTKIEDALKNPTALGKQKELVYSKLLGRPVDVERLKDAGSKAVIAAGAAAIVGWKIHNSRVSKQLNSRDKIERDKYKATVRKAKRNKRARDREIQRQYDSKERRIESKYPRGSKLSQEDYSKLSNADRQARDLWKKSKQTYKQAKRAARSKYTKARWSV